MHDNNIELSEHNDYYNLSIDYWRMFTEQYGADMVIQVRKYASLKDLIRKPVMESEKYLAMRVNLDGHFEPTKLELENQRDLAERYRLETQYMNELQQSDKKWKRYYYISMDWVTEWLAYAEAED